MRIFIVWAGEDYEGGFVKGVFKDKEAAIQFALGVDPHFSKWIPDEGEENSWHSGCDFVKVLEWEVGE